ncbi:thioesterase family protein [Sinorhizobium mexicanum]|uniref:Thioesterase n=1 Tax=Sinorhizobium mexicanum TaxID=375549 RepID=A0A859QM28_9HYPH|nr:thioesterase family protein [Sinorhizobium mexicanum]MBP1885149.1 acyl-CoA thioesterase FadM [Sinorhizobium mexicanum]QLL64405.1 thioesterase [Sinorhizobium mexicanum]
MTWTKTWEGVVEEDWLDELGHVNFLTYQRIADFASVDIWRRAQANERSASNVQFVVVEMHVRYLRELLLMSRVEIYSSLIAWDTKRFHLLHRIESAGAIACTVETMNLCFDVILRKIIPLAPATSSYFASWCEPPKDAVPRLSITGRRHD